MSFPGVAPALLAALEEKGYREPTPVQAAVLEAADGADLLVSAQTGSGKTVAYGLAMAAGVLGRPARPGRCPAGLVVAPTRELALQVARELGWLHARTGVRIATCVGGMDMRREERTLRAGCDLVVGTPGRLCDHVRRGSLVASELRAIVLDEADEMLDLGFREDLEFILDAAPAQRRTLMFSATLPPPIVALARKYQVDAKRVAISPQDEPHGDIDYVAMVVAPRDREHAVVNVLRWFDVRGALVFCSTREGVKRLHGNLQERGFSVVALSGELSQAERGRALQALRDGRARACIATDVAARGLDLPDLGLVLHADLPRDRATLVHRSGRTGRAGRKGTCVLIVPQPLRGAAERVLKSAAVRARWVPAPSADSIRERDQETLVLEVAKLTEEPTAEDLAVARRLLERQGAEALAAALVRLHRRQRPAPEELAPVGPERPWYDRPARTSFRPGRPAPGKGRPRPGGKPRPHRGKPPGKPR